MDNQLIITPKTKVLQLIQHYPELEEILISVVPAFKKLKNPILRQTVAKVATLQQAAGIGNIKVEDLINRLRREVGQDDVCLSEANKYNHIKPDWFEQNKVTQSLDAGELLKQGEHPVNQVMADLKALPQGDIYEMTAPFVPVPLIDKATSMDYMHWIQKENESCVKIYFTKV